MWCMKEPDYVMRIMATGGSLLADDETCKLAHRGVGDSRVSFRYPRPYDWHFRYRHAVDDHNNLRHTLPSLEDTWVTQDWPVRVFTFLLAVTEVNTYLVLSSFVFVAGATTLLPTYHEFRRRLAWEFIDNEFLPPDYREDSGSDAGPVCLDNKHCIATAPPHASEYRCRQWFCNAAQKYQQYTCKRPGCKKVVRTYCPCNPGYWLCANHIVEHAIDCTVEDFVGR